MNKKIGIIVIMILWMQSFIGYGLSESKIEKTFPISTKNIIFNEDMTFQGVKDSKMIYFTVSKGWKMGDDNYVEVDLDYSEMIQKNGAGVTVLLNEKPIESILLSNKEEKRKIILPKQEIQEGYNRLQFKTFSKVTNSVCEDRFNPNNWIRIDGSSYIHLSYKEVLDDEDLSNYPYPYFESLSDDPYKSYLIMPIHASKDTLESMMTYMTHVGNILKEENERLQVRNFDGQSDKNQIFIGSLDEAPSYIKGVLSKEEIQKLDKEALIKAKKLKNNKKLLLIMSNDSNALMKGVLALTDENMIKGMGKDSTFIGKDQLFKAIEKDPSIQTFKDLGYDHRKIKNLKNMSMEYGFKPPKDWKIKNESTITIKGSISSAIHKKNSNVSVWINDVPLGSETLEHIKNNDFEMTFHLKDEILNASYWNIKVCYDLSYDDDNCLDFDEDLWGFVSNESTINLKYDKKDDFVLNDSIGLFIKDGKVNRFSMVVPEKLNIEDMNNIAKIVGAIGAESQRIQPVYIYTDLSKVKENTIIYGKGEDQKNIFSVNDGLEIPFSKDASYLKIPQNVQGIEDRLKKGGSIQLIHSEKLNNHYGWIVTGVTDKGLALSANVIGEQVLLDPKYETKSVVIDLEGRVYEGVKKKTDRQKNEKDTRNPKLQEQNIEVHKFVTIAVILIISIGSIMVMLFLKKRKK